ncbi:MAG: T9SS type A sorting domain-containing protein [Candidatus Fermentibacterota bacterium]
MLSHLLLVTALTAFPSRNVHGSLEQQGPIEVLNLWGSWEEMGYAHGYLLAPRIKLVYETYMVELAGGVSNIEALRLFYIQHFQTPPRFSAYAAGGIAGMADSVDLYSDVFGRELDTLDVLVASAVQDFSGATPLGDLLCSSVSSWGEATASEPELAGAPAMSRNLDFFVDSAANVFDAQLLVTLDPDSGQDFVSIGFSGYLGTLSGMNESGVCAALNMGDHKGITTWKPDFVPITMALAMGLCDEDFDGSGDHDAGDMVAALTEYNRSSSYIIHVLADPDLAWQGDTGLVVEVNNSAGHAVRTAGDEPPIAPDHMAATNHHRKLYSPSPGWRYPLLVDSMAADPDMTLDRFWGLMGEVGFQPAPGTGGTIQTMIFAPQQRRIGLAFSTDDAASWEQDPWWLDWDDLFPNHDPQSADPHQPQSPGLRIRPNPATGTVTVAAPGPGWLGVYDLCGRRVSPPLIGTSGDSRELDVSALSPGVYLVVHRGEAGMRTARMVVAGGGR